MSKQMRSKLLAVVKPRADDVIIDILEQPFNWIVYVWNNSERVAIKYIIDIDFEIEKKEIL